MSETTIPAADWQSIQRRARGDREQVFDHMNSWQDGYRHALARSHDAHVKLAKPPQPPSEEESR